MFQKIHIFAVLNTHKGGLQTRRFVAAGIFYACSIHNTRFCTPVWRLNGPTALVVLSNGKGRTVFHFCLQLKTSVMLNTETQKVEQEKTALFEAKTRLYNSFGGQQHMLPELNNSFCLLNSTLLQLACHASKINLEHLFDENLSAAIYDMHCAIDFFKHYEETLKKLQQ